MSSQGNAPSHRITRRGFLRGVGATVLTAAAAAAPVGDDLAQARPAAGQPKPRFSPPHWRGFNLHDLMGYPALTRYQGDRFKEEEFRWIADWTFNFVRLLVHHAQVTIDGDCARPDEAGLAEVDRGIEYGRKHGLHVCLNLRGAPGHPPLQRAGRDNLWKVQTEAEGLCALWKRFAERYQGIPSARLSFNLLNEVPQVSDYMSAADCVRVIGAATAAIRAVTPDRFIITDGANWGAAPCPEPKDLGLGQSVHIYMPLALTHYRAPYMPGWEKYPEPRWPDLVWEGKTWNRTTLAHYYQPWFALAKEGVFVHCGEFGVYNKTPHPITLAWMHDVLEMLAAHSIGFAMWTFAGELGVIDSGRADVDYEDFHGHALDRTLLTLLQRY